MAATRLSLDELASMAEADEHGNRYELSPDGILSVTPLDDVQHAVLASRLQGWFLLQGWPPDLVLQNCGLRVLVADGVGGRVPDLTVWNQPSEAEVWGEVGELDLAVEIVSPSSAAMDHVTKLDEYAAAGVPRYWIVDRDAASTVIRYELVGDAYSEVGRQPLAWLLNTDPADHL